MRIEVDDPASADVQALLEEHLPDMHSLSPPESVHAHAVSLRRRGADRALLQHIVAVARARGYRRLSLAEFVSAGL